MHTYIYIYIYIEREKEIMHIYRYIYRERERERLGLADLPHVDLVVPGVGRDVGACIFDIHYIL